MYQFKEDRDHSGHFWFDRKLIEDKNWSLLSKAGKAVYPVIAAHRNGKTGESFPSERTIAIMCGRSDKIVRGGIRDIDEFPGVEIIPYVTARGKKSKKFKVEAPPQEHGRAFPFYKYVFESGIWSQMKPTGQSLYPVLRHFSFFDYEFYAGTEEDDDMDTLFAERKWDCCEADYDVLADHAGITRRSVSAALEDLERVSLVERLSDLIKVYIRPQVYYKREFLNGQTANKYRHLIGA